MTFEMVVKIVVEIKFLILTEKCPFFRFMLSSTHTCLETLNLEIRSQSFNDQILRFDHSPLFIFSYKIKMCYLKTFF
ncbi:hypothetical protein M153_15100016661 [Pseudoloma neurophilia]|uniref:Uncharacterized protein n=1 Tax=Pseudoloma neurophilia TaxID=146866 RepID=A0A0R0LZK7_9MICR|nr:hypothetical protein M153_15100016661 [Pseudoloma neurophilia]